MKDKVTSLSVLEKAEEELHELQASEVSTLIEAIGEVTLDSKSQIEAARKEYNALDTEARKLVTDYGNLETAEKKFAELKKVEDDRIAAEKEAEKKRILSEVTSKFNLEEDRVQNLTWYMPKGMPEYIDTRSYILPYIGVKGKDVWLCIRYNYASDDWVFWEKITIVADGEKFLKTFNYFDIIRDNKYGNVWEYYDDCLNINLGMDNKNMKMLKKIADSKETIVRYQGKDYYEDLTVIAADKTTIQDVLDLYSALLP